MQATMSQSQAVSWIKQSIGRYYDFDGWYGFQCYDYANAYWNKLFPGTQLKGVSAANIHTDNKELLKGRATVHKNTRNFLAKPGDIVIFNRNYGSGHGHVGVVISATLNYIIIVEQNWLGGGWTSGNAQGGKGWESATKRKHSYDFPMHFIRPNWKKATKKKATKKSSSKNTVYYNWKGRFTANTTIKVRRSPSLKGAVVDTGSWIYKNQWVDIVQLKKDRANKLWWGKFKYPTNPSAGYFWMALGEITDKHERIKNEKKLYGSVKWK